MLIIEIPDGPLTEAIDKAAEQQQTTPHKLVVATLIHCNELEILKTVLATPDNPAGQPEDWGDD